MGDHSLQSHCCVPAVGTRTLLAAQDTLDALHAVRENLLCLWLRLCGVWGAVGGGLDQPVRPGDRTLWLCTLNTHTEGHRSLS